MVMIDKLKKNWGFIVLSIAVLLLLLNIKQCNKSKEQEAKYEKFDQSMAAINDSLKKTVNAQGHTVFTKKAVEFALKGLLESEGFKSLSEENKKFYQELQKVKGLIASSQATINAQAEIIKNLSYGQGVTVTDSNVCFIKGSSQTIEDSTKALNFKHTLTFGNTLKSDFKYTYKAKIQTSFIRNKDKSIRIEYKLDDPDAIMTDGQAFIIPQEELTKYQKFILKNGRWLKPITYSLTAITGGYIGFKLAQ